MFEAYDQLSQAELGYQVAWLCHRLGRISWLLAFHEAVEQLQKQSGSCQLAAQVLALLEKNYRHASFHARTCYAALLAEYRVLSFYPNDRLISFLFRLLEEQNDLCSAEYALQALYAAGDPELVLRALSALDRPEGLAIHRKVLVRGAAAFSAQRSAHPAAVVWVPALRHHAGCTGGFYSLRLPLLASGGTGAAGKYQ